MSTINYMNIINCRRFKKKEDIMLNNIFFYNIMIVSDKNLTLKVAPTSKIGQACVSVSFPIKVNHLLISSLVEGNMCLAGNEYVDNTIVAYAAFKKLHSSLIEDTFSMSKHKLSSLSCNCTGKYFTISGVCDKSFTAARKLASSICKGLKFGPNFAIYKKICDSLNIKADKDAFNNAVNECVDAVDKQVYIAFTGKIKVTKDNLEKALSTIGSKFSETDGKPEGSSRNVNLPDCKHDFSVYKGENDMSALIAHGYISQYAPAFLCGSNIFVQSNYDSVIKSIKDSAKIGRYVDKLVKLGDDLAGILSFQGSSQAILSAPSVNENTKFNKTNLKSAIYKSIA